NSHETTRRRDKKFVWFRVNSWMIIFSFSLNYRTHVILIQEEAKMNELINQVVQRTGIPEDKAKMAVETVLGFLKTKLPAPIAGQIDSVVGGGGGESSAGGLG